MNAYKGVTTADGCNQVSEYSHRRVLYWSHEERDLTVCHSIGRVVVRMVWVTMGVTRCQNILTIRRFIGQTKNKISRSATLLIAGRHAVPRFQGPRL
jgi:hypothetical protein